MHTHTCKQKKRVPQLCTAMNINYIIPNKKKTSHRHDGYLTGFPKMQNELQVNKSYSWIFKVETTHEIVLRRQCYADTSLAFKTHWKHKCHWLDSTQQNTTLINIPILNWWIICFEKHTLLKNNCVQNFSSVLMDLSEKQKIYY